MTVPSSQPHDFKGNVSQLSFKLKVFRAALRMINAAAPDLSARFLLSLFLKPRRKAGDDYLPDLPMGAQRLEIFHNLTKLTGWSWGEKSRRAVLLIHGWEGHTGRLLPLIKPLLEQGFRVVTFDAPGHGLSPQSSTHLVDCAHAVQDVIEQHGPFYSIIAHSFGAAATAVTLAAQPQLMPHKLVLLSPMRDLDQHIDIFAQIAGLSPARKERLRALIATHVGLPLAQCSTVNAVRTFKTPGLVIHDRHDTLIPYEVGMEIARNWLGSKLVTTEQLGHRLHLQDTQVMHTILAFLTFEAIETSRCIPDVSLEPIEGGYVIARRVGNHLL